jgi:hypothetical protein
VSKVVVVLKLQVYTGNWPVNKQDWLRFLSKQIRLATFYFLAKNETLCTNKDVLKLYGKYVISIHVYCTLSECIVNI